MAKGKFNHVLIAIGLKGPVQPLVSKVTLKGNAA